MNKPIEKRQGELTADDLHIAGFETMDVEIARIERKRAALLSSFQHPAADLAARLTFLMNPSPPGLSTIFEFVDGVRQNAVIDDEVLVDLATALEHFLGDQSPKQQFSKFSKSLHLTRTAGRKESRGAPLRTELQAVLRVLTLEQEGVGTTQAITDVAPSLSASGEGTEKERTLERWVRKHRRYLCEIYDAHEEYHREHGVLAADDPGLAMCAIFNQLADTNDSPCAPRASAPGRVAQGRGRQRDHNDTG